MFGKYYVNFQISSLCFQSVCHYDLHESTRCFRYLLFLIFFMGFTLILLKDEVLDRNNLLKKVVWNSEMRFFIITGYNSHHPHHHSTLIVVHVLYVQFTNPHNPHWTTNMTQTISPTHLPGNIINMLSATNVDYLK